MNTRIKSKPKLILVGAGPGDPELISVKGLKALQKAKVVLYDALVHTDLLDEIPKDAVKVFVGKRAGKHSFKQEQINKLIVKYALTFGEVVRLKGGDPFVFGRGKEEVEFAANYGVENEVIPGLSSSTSLPALQGISLTQRNVNESFWVLTGTKSDGSISADLKLAAQSTATVVVLMGRRKLEQIASLYQAQGRGELPVAVIQNGSLPNEKVVLGKVSNIAQRADAKGIGTPAIIVLGEVVGQHPKYVYQFIEQELSLPYNKN